MLRLSTVNPSCKAHLSRFCSHSSSLPKHNKRLSVPTSWQSCTFGLKLSPALIWKFINQPKGRWQFSARYNTFGCKVAKYCKFFNNIPPSSAASGECLPYRFLFLERVKALNVHICSIQYAHPSSRSIAKFCWAGQRTNSLQP